MQDRCSSDVLSASAVLVSSSPTTSRKRRRSAVADRCVSAVQCNNPSQQAVKKIRSKVADQAVSGGTDFCSKPPFESPKRFVGLGGGSMHESSAEACAGVMEGGHEICAIGCVCEGRSNGVYACINSQLSRLHQERTSRMEHTGIQE